MAVATPGGWRRRIRTAVTASAVAMAALAGVLVAMHPFGAAADGVVENRWAAGAGAAREHGPLAFPVSRPPGLIDVRFPVTSEAGPIGLFHASGEPAVAVCAGSPGDCRRALPTSTILAARHGGPTLFVVPGEPVTRSLSDEADRYWRTVGFVSRAPAWFPR